MVARPASRARGLNLGPEEISSSRAPFLQVIDRATMVKTKGWGLTKAPFHSHPSRASPLQHFGTDFEKSFCPCPRPGPCNSQVRSFAASCRAVGTDMPWSQNGSRACRPNFRLHLQLLRRRKAMLKSIREGRKGEEGRGGRGQEGGGKRVATKAASLGEMNSYMQMVFEDRLEGGKWGECPPVLRL